ncbi:MAG: hypothetical protein R3B48_09205 [Kofleriaceae bacterium]
MTRLTRMILLILLCCCAVSCDKGATNPADTLYKQEQSADNLKGLIEAIVKAQESGDLATAAKLANNLVADADTLKKAFKDDPPSDFFATQVERLGRFPSTEAELANLVRRGKPQYTQINIHATTTEELIANTGVAAREFSQVPRDFAANLRPGMTFYAQEFVEPGKEAGRKYLMFLWDGARWRMIGPSWR